MARDATSCILLLVSITASTAFQAPSAHYGRGHAHALERARAPRAPRHAAPTPLRRNPVAFNQPFVHGPAVPEMMSVPAVQEFAQPAAMAQPVHKSPPFSTTVISGAVFLAMMKIYHLGWAAAPCSWTLLVHACAGALGGLAALVSNSAVSGKDSRQALKTIVESFKITAVSKAANAFTFAYINQAMTALALGSAGIVAAAAGVGVVATLMQQLSLGAVNTKGFFRENVWRNVFVFEAFWLTYAGICALSPAMSITYTGLMISGGISGVVSTMVASVQFTDGAQGFVQRLRWGYAAVCKTINGAEFSKAALQSGIFFVVYQAAYNTLM